MTTNNTPTREEYEATRNAIYMTYDAKRNARIAAMHKAQLPAHLIAQAARELYDAYRATLAADPLLIAYHAQYTRV